MSLTARLLALALAAGGMACGSFGAGIQPAAAAPAPGGEIAVTTDLGGARDLARKALLAGRPDLAASIARQILAVSPQDAAAHLLLAAALTRSGEAAEALPVARDGFRLAEGREVRFEAAFLAAEAAAGAGRPMVAKYWLRRADGWAPDETYRKVLATAYANVSARSPFSFSASVYGGPSENVNGGSLHDTFWFYGIPIPITQALPGQVLGSSLQASYRLSPATQLTAQWAHGEVILGDRARSIDPAARAGDYRKDELRLGIATHWQDGGGKTAMDLRASLGRRWTAGDVTAEIADARLDLWRMPDEAWMLGLRLDLQSVGIPGRPVADSLTHRLSFSASHRAQGLGAVTLRLGGALVDSEAAGIAWRGPVLSLGWRPAIRSDKLGLDFDVEVEQRDYWLTPSFDPDLGLRLSVTAELPGLQKMGFVPSVTLSAERTRSQVVVRDTRDIGLSVGLSSRF